MRPTDYEIFRKILLALRARLVGDVNHMAGIALNPTGAELSSMPDHPADASSESFDRDFTLQLVQSGQETLQSIDEALQRLEDGTYGTCEVCGGRIPKMRLKVIPYASMCVKCAEKSESF